MLRCIEKIILLLAIVLVPTKSSKQYRNDYVYNRKTDAFYKFHIESERFHRARVLCKIEGGALLHVDSEEDVFQVHEMFKQYPDIGDDIWIDTDGKEHELLEEKPTINFDDSSDEESLYFLNSLDKYDVMTRQGEIKSTESQSEIFPFVCKVSASDAIFDNRCMVYGKDYTYYENVGSCYKVPMIAFSWNQAYAECRAEGAHLAVLNSITEHDVVLNLIKSLPDVSGSQFAWFFFVGVRAEKKTDGSPIVFKTIFNQTLETAGYSQWMANEPNNILGKEYCATMFRGDGSFNDVDCTHLYPFLCENEVKDI